ncbi:heterokaryon incompatibility protein-domain-containing protein [Xylaria castorea]|nr:heterokaryon incompatibility protein-domain-containing protein [Xylaria castorea]
MKNMEQTLFSSLRGPGPDFRLVLLLPGDGSSDVHCQLLVSSLDHPPHFEALSYVWGDINDKVAITIEGQAHHVAKNLHVALRCLRYPDRARTLWVDALCINQNDPNERNHQVRLMGRIYTTANHVVAWMGQANHEDEDVIRLVEASGGDPKLHWTELLASVSLLSLVSFLRNPWWDRVWTAQEAVLARDLTFQYGHKSISRATMMGMLRSFHVHLYNCCISVTETWMDNRTEFKGALDLMWITELQLKPEIFRAGASGRSFCQAVSYFRHREATNLRDKVYGLLGIVDDAQYITIDYDLPVELVYENSAREIITNSRTLDLFSHLTASLRPEKSLCNDPTRKRLPSWVPNWNNGFSTILHPSFGRVLRLETLSLFKACGSHLFKPVKGDKQGSLRVKGIMFDTVERISPCSPSVPNNGVVWVVRLGGMPFDEKEKVIRSARNRHKFYHLEVIRDWRNMARVEEEPEQPYPSGGTILEAFWRTLCLDVSSIRKKSQSDTRFYRADQEDRLAHDHFWLVGLRSLYDRPTRDQLLNNPQHQPDSNSTENHIIEAILDRRFIFSKKGYIGLAPNGVKEGDMICVLAGGHLPFVLRGVKTATNNSSRAEIVCTIIGDAYLHGIMDGEVVNKVDEGGEKFRTFKLV